MQDIKIETNKFKRVWIWIWYNDVTRICVLLGLPIFPVIFLSYLLFGPGEYMKVLVLGTYIFFFSWGMLDNDYSNLRRIGMNEYRKKL